MNEPRQIHQRYQVEQRLGEGATAQVFRVRDQLHPERNLALKQLHISPSRHASGVYLQLLSSEFKLLSTLNHPNLAAVHDFGLDRANCCYYFTTDFVDGPTIREHLATATPDLVLASLVQLLRVLQYVHSRGLFHADIKPENILVQLGEADPESRIKLLDFGFAIATGEERRAMVGTLPYMAPELFLEQPPTIATDLYAVGVLAYELLTGQRPFSAHSFPDWVQAHLQEQWPPPSSLRPELPAAVDELIDGLLAKDPARRFSQAAEVISAINRLFSTEFSIETARTVTGYLHTHRFIARDEPFQQLLRAHDALFQETPRGAQRFAFAVRGESGVGKTRLLTEFKRQIQLQKQRDLFSYRCLPHSVPWQAIRQWLRWAASHDQTDALTQRVHQVELALQGGDASLRPGESFDTQRERLIDSMTRIILDAARLQPIVALIDDAQNLDAPSLEVVRLILHNLAYHTHEAARLLLVVAFSDENLGESGLRSLSAELSDHFTSLSLARFDEREVGELIQGTFPGREVPEHFVSVTYRTSGGNPLFVEELLKDLYEDGIITLTGKQLLADEAHLSELARPRNLLESVQRRMAKLSDDGIRVLRVLALLDQPIDAAAIGKILNETEATCDAILADLVMRGIASRVPVPNSLASGEKPYTLRADGDGWCYSLANITFRKALAEERDDRQLRLQVIALLETLLDHEPTGDVTQLTRALALHYCHLGEIGPAVRNGMRAAKGFAQRYAYKEAADLLALLLEKGASDISAVEHREMRLELAKLLFRTGDLDGAYHHCEEAQRLGLTMPHLQSRILIHRGDLAQAIGVLDQAIGRFSGLELAELYTILIHGLQLIGDYQRALACSRDAFREIDRAVTASTGGAAEASAGHRLKGEILIYLGRVHYYRGDYTKAIETYRQALGLFEAVGDEETTVYLYNSIGIVYHQLGDLESAIENYRRNLEIAQRVGHRIRMSVATMNLGVVFHNQGRYGDALAHYGQSYAIARELNAKMQMVQAGANLALLHSILGDLESAKALCDQCLDVANALDNKMMAALVRLTIFDIALTERRHDDAQHQIDEALRLFEALSSSADVARARLHRIELLIRRQQFPEAQREFDALRPLLESSDVKSLIAEAALRRCDLELLRPDGDVQIALAKARESEGRASELDDPALDWQIAHRLCHCYHRLGDEVSAREWAQRTRDVVDQIASHVPESMHADFKEKGLCHQAYQDPVLLGLLGLDRSISLGGNVGMISLFDNSQQFGEFLMARLLSIYKRINSQHAVDRLLDEIMDAAIDLTGAERGFLILSNAEDELVVEVARNIDHESIRKNNQKISFSIAERVFESDEALLSVDAMKDERFSEAMSIYALKLRSILCIPLRTQGRVIGVLYIDNRFQKGAFNDTHLRTMEAFADQAAIAIWNARLFAANKKAHDDLEQALEEIASLNALLKQQLDDRSAELFETQKLVRQQRSELAFKYKYENIIGRGAKMQRVFQILDRVTASAMPVLIIGESGTGKELIARALHYNSPNKDKRFVSINCGALTESLLESELFGHVRGAFTGADRDKPGLFEVASGGTLFLDEVGDMSRSMQVKLLRVLQEGELRRVGGKDTIKVNARVVAATNRNLERMVDEGTFRQDLYYRLNVVLITVPSLRERREDIPLLVDHFVQKFAAENQHSQREIDAKAMRLLSMYDWPGNIRQLETVVYNLCLFASEDRIGPSDIQSHEHLLPATSVADDDALGSSEDETTLSLATVERAHIKRVLAQNNSNKTEAARILGIDRKTLYNKIKAYHLES